MEDLKPEDLEDLLQELEKESGAEESLPREVEDLLHVLQSGSHYLAREAAAELLGQVGTSSTQIVQTLARAQEADPHPEVRSAAARALRAPVHVEYLQQRPDPVAQAETETVEPAAAAKPVASPAHFQVETEGRTLRISWRPEFRQRIENALVPLLLALLSILLLVGGSQDVCTILFCVVAFCSGYWALAVLVNATRVIAGQEEWIVQRGPLPLPKRQFYLHPRRVDRAACQWVWTERVEEYKLKLGGSSGSGGSAEGPLGCLLLLVELGVFLSSIRRELVVTYKLNARCVDGGDQELLRLSSKREAEYLEYTLQNQLDARGGLPAQE